MRHRAVPSKPLIQQTGLTDSDQGRLYVSSRQRNESAVVRYRTCTKEELRAVLNLIPDGKNPSDNGRSRVRKSCFSLAALLGHKFRNETFSITLSFAKENRPNSINPFLFSRRGFVLNMLRTGRQLPLSIGVLLNF